MIEPYCEHEKTDDNKIERIINDALQIQNNCLSSETFNNGLI